jgi:CubicO group peptidase (beta-lactamase class C family)
MRFTQLIIALSLIISNIISGRTFPGETWNYNSNKRNPNWDSKGLQEFRDYIVDSTVVTGLVIVHKGEIIFEYGDIVENSYIASCRKSVLSMLYGKYVENSVIDLNKTVQELGIDDVDGILPEEKKATIQEIISARSGIYHKEGYPGGMQQYAPERGSVKHGSYWLYSNWDFNVAGYIFEQETGKDIYDEVEAQLAIPLNMEDWYRNLQVKSGDTTISKYLAYPMFFSTRDMARLGLLMLNKGNWNGKQVISEAWVNEMVKERTSYVEVNKNVPGFRNSGLYLGYGYMWWLLQNMQDKRYENAYAARGAMGQSITVYPAIDVVLAFKTKSDYKRSNSGKVRLNLERKVPTYYTGPLNE